MRQRDIIFVGVLALIAMTGGLLSWLAPPPEVTIRESARSPDYFLRAFSNTVYDAAGEITRELAAERMQHFPDDDSTELERPRITLYGKEETRWSVTSEEGRFSGDGGVLLLEGSVRIVRNDGEESRDVQMETSELLVYPERNLMETGAEIRIASSDSWIRADGMRAWFGEHARIKLLSRVRGHYEVQ